MKDIYKYRVNILNQSENGMCEEINLGTCNLDNLIENCKAKKVVEAVNNNCDDILDDLCEFNLRIIRDTKQLINAFGIALLSFELIEII